MDVLGFTCPRCRTEVSARFYGPCDDCRGALRSRYEAVATGAAPAEVGRFEPKMNVVPNQVATKD